MGARKNKIKYWLEVHNICPKKWTIPEKDGPKSLSFFQTTPLFQLHEQFNSFKAKLVHWFSSSHTETFPSQRSLLARRYLFCSQGAGKDGGLKSQCWDMQGNELESNHIVNRRLTCVETCYFSRVNATTASGSQHTHTHKLSSLTPNVRCKSCFWRNIQTHFYALSTDIDIKPPNISHNGAKIRGTSSSVLHDDPSLKSNARLGHILENSHL